LCHRQAQERLNKLYETGEINFNRQNDWGMEKDNIHAINSIGILYYNQDKHDLAIQYYQLAIDKGCANAINNLGYLYQAQNKYDLAIQHYQWAIEKGDIEAFSNLGYLYKKRGENDLAIKCYLLGIEKNDSVSLAQIKNIITDLKLYYKLSQIKNKHKEVTNLMIQLRNNKDVHCFNNKKNFLSKTDICLICQDETNVIPLNCAHFYCEECYTSIDKCAVCGF